MSRLNVHAGCTSGFAGPHAVTQIAGTRNATYCYDAREVECSRLRQLWRSNSGTPELAGGGSGCYLVGDAVVLRQAFVLGRTCHQIAMPGLFS